MNPALLADLAQDFLDAAVLVLTEASLEVPDRAYVAHGVNVVHDCEQLAVSLAIVQPVVVDEPRGRCMVRLQATFVIQLLRCVTPATDDEPIPDKDVLHAEDLGLLTDGWVVLKGLTRMWAQGELPSTGQCSAVTWGALEPLGPTDLAGWQLTVTVDL